MTYDTSISGAALVGASIGVLSTNNEILIVLCIAVGGIMGWLLTRG